MGSTSPELFVDAVPTLKGTYTTLAKQLPASDSDTPGPVVILDGLAELLWVGFTPVQISQFVRAILSLGKKVCLNVLPFQEEGLMI